MKKLILLVALLLLPSVSFGAFDTNLSYGSSGPKVLELQEFLTAQGVYSGPITGNFYSLTLAGVKGLQVKLGVSPVSGFFGPLTRAAANTVLTATLAPSVGAAIDETGNEPVPAENDKTEELIKEVKKLNETVKTQQTQLEAIKENTKPAPIIMVPTPVAPVAPTIEKVTIDSTWRNGVITVTVDGDFDSARVDFHPTDPERVMYSKDAQLKVGQNQVRVNPEEYDWVVTAHRTGFNAAYEQGTITVTKE